jgi:hypothetical protein
MSKVSSTALQTRCNESQNAGPTLVAKLALDSICQNSSVHVTRTKLLLKVLIGGLTERLATSDDAICEHPNMRPLRVVQSARVLSTEPHSCKPLCAYAFDALRRTPPSKHNLPLLPRNYHGTAHEVRAMHIRCTSRYAVVEVLAAESHRASA